MLAAIRAMTWGVEATVAYASSSTVAAFAELEDFLDQPSPDDASDGARDLVEDLAEADARAAAAASKAADAVAPGLQAARAQMVDALSSVAPGAALHLLRTPEAAVRIEHYESTRFGWLLATMGRGSAAALSDWNHYAEICQLWLGEFTAASHVQTLSGGALTNIEMIAPLLRLGPSSTRLRWAADLLCEGIGEWADASGNKALQPFFSSSMQAVNASVARLLAQPHAVADESTFSGIDARLLKWLTAEPARNEPADFEKRLLSTDPDTQPLAMIGGMLQPVNAGAWYFNREIAVLAALRDHMGSREQGKAYEAALVHVVKAVGPPDLTACSDRRIGPPGTTGKRSHEVDLVIGGEDLLVVGEAKAYIPARHGSGVSSSYEDQLLKSVHQIQVRLAALEGEAVFGSPPMAVDVSHRMGLCVPLHDYGGTAWSGDALARYFTSNPCVVMPAHGFALAMSCLRNAAEVSGYLRMRLSLSNGLVAGLDELEPLLGWIHGGYPEKEIPQGGPRIGHLRLYELDGSLALYETRPTDRDIWIEQVYAMSAPIDVLDGGEIVVDAGEVLHRLSVHIIDRLENGGPISLGRGARPQVWLQLLSFPPFRAGAIDTTVDAAVEVLRSHNVSTASLRTLSIDATDAEWSDALRVARMLLIQALERASTRKRWWKPSTWPRRNRRLDASIAGRTPPEVMDLMLAITNVARRALLSDESSKS
jgi:hypothetical protein